MHGASSFWEKKRDSNDGCLSTYAVVLLLDDSTGRTDIGTSATINTGSWVDYIDISFGNSSGGAFWKASSTSNASISDFVSHTIDSLLHFRCLRLYTESAFESRKTLVLYKMSVFHVP